MAPIEIGRNRRPRGASLHAAARAGDHELLELLLAHGSADPNGHDRRAMPFTQRRPPNCGRRSMGRGGTVDPYDPWATPLAWAVAGGATQRSPRSCGVWVRQVTESLDSTLGKTACDVFACIGCGRESDAFLSDQNAPAGSPQSPVTGQRLSIYRCPASTAETLVSGCLFRLALSGS